MPGPLIGLAPATIQIMRMAAQQGVKITAREAAKLAAKRQAGLQAATAGTNLGRNIGTASEGLATKVLGNKALQDATLATAMGSIPVGTGVAGYLYGLDNPREEPVEEEGIEALIRKDTDFANGGTVKRRVPDVYFQRYQDGGSVYNIGDPGPSSPDDPFEDIPYGDIRMPEVYKGYPEVYEREKEEYRRALENNYNQQEGSDTTYGDDAFARELYEREQRQKIQEVLKSLGQGEGLAHGGAVRPRGYNMGGAVMPPPQQQPQGIATMMSDPRTNMGNMPNQQQQQQQQQLSALQTTANAANLNANNLQKTMQKQQQQAMASGQNKVTSPISQIRIPSTKRRQFEDTLLNSRRRGQKASQDAQMRASIPSTMFG